MFSCFLEHDKKKLDNNVYTKNVTTAKHMPVKLFLLKKGLEKSLLFWLFYHQIVLKN
jgi:hypothetical protein